MAIRRVGAARKGYATRTANPRKRTATKKRATARKTTARKAAPKRRRKRATARRVSVKGILVNPKRRRRRRTTAKRANPVRRRRSTARRVNPARRRRRNPSSGSRKKGLLMVAGVDMGLVALGTVSAVVIKNGLNSIPGISDLIAKLPASVQPLASPAIVIGAGWAIHKYAKNKTLKQIGAYAAVSALVLAVDDFAQKQMGDMFKSGTGGAYHNYGGAYQQLSGAHMNLGTGGAYVALPNPKRHIGAGSFFSGAHSFA